VSVDLSFDLADAVSILLKILGGPAG
jgi:hypothetical protein